MRICLVLAGTIGEGISSTGRESFYQGSVENVVFDLDIKAFPG